MREQKDKIEKLLDGIDTLALSAAKFEAEINGLNVTMNPQTLAQAIYDRDQGAQEQSCN